MARYWDRYGIRGVWYRFYANPVCTGRYGTKFKTLVLVGYNITLQFPRGFILLTLLQEESVNALKFLSSFRNSLKNLARVSYQRMITHVWMTQVQLSMEIPGLHQIKLIQFLLPTQWDKDVQHGPGLEPLTMDTQGMLATVPSFGFISSGIQKLHSKGMWNTYFFLFLKL